MSFYSALIFKLNSEYLYTFLKYGRAQNLITGEWQKPWIGDKRHIQVTSEPLLLPWLILPSVVYAYLLLIAVEVENANGAPFLLLFFCLWCEEIYVNPSFGSSGWLC